MQAPPQVVQQAPQVVTPEPNKPPPVFGSPDKEGKKSYAKKKGTSGFQIDLQGIEGEDALTVPSTV
jgi:hypothetical protein